MLSMDYIFIHFLTQTPQTRGQTQFLVCAHFTENPVLYVLSRFIGGLTGHGSNLTPLLNTHNAKCHYVTNNGDMTPYSLAKQKIRGHVPVIPVLV